MSHKSSREYLRRIHQRYAEADRTGKGRILDEFCEVAGFHRKYALRLLNGPPPDPVPKRRRQRPERYSAAVVSALEAIWVAAGYPWSVRLKALLPTWLPWARRRFRLTPHVQRQLLQISPRQIDRRLQDRKHRLKRRLYGRTKPGTLLKHHIPLKTDRWDVTAPGFTEIDLVAHSGNSADGVFLHSLNLTDIHTTWVETRAIMGRGQVEVQKALAEIRSALPFLLRGIDADNGSEFINLHLYGYCQSQAIQFTRGRPYKKDDNAHIEQKNWTHVRKLLGYARYDSLEALRAINALYVQDLRLLQNLFLPSVKLLCKERVGSRIRRRYDRPQTPFERVLACPEADARACARLRLLRDRLDPFELSLRIDQQIERIQALAGRTRLSQATHRRGSRIHIRPETSLEALRRAGAPL
ncbi:MAG TPA: integrase [Candidatus Binatia bacterium]|nr:integrase [Candidatus Binatia bacterium]